MNRIADLLDTPAACQSSQEDPAVTLEQACEAFLKLKNHLPYSARIVLRGERFYMVRYPGDGDTHGTEFHELQAQPTHGWSVTVEYHEQYSFCEPLCIERVGATPSDAADFAIHAWKQAMERRAL